MKQLKILPLVAIISGVMVGCGGGSGGGSGGGGSVTPQTKLNFTFVVPKTQELASNGSCTIYDRFESNGEEHVLNYHQLGGVLDTQLTAYYSKPNGEREGDLITANNDKLTITLQSIPEGGSVTIQEVAYGTRINALTFSKQLLASDTSIRNVYVSAESKVANTTCLSIKNSNDISKLRDDLDYTYASGTTGVPYPTFYFDSQYETVTANESRFTKEETLTAVSTENTMIAQYRTDSRSSLFQYGFDGTNANEMVAASYQSTPVVSSSAINFSTIAIDTIYNNFSYQLAEVARSSTFYHPESLNGDVWTFSVDGGIATSGWDARYTDKVADDWSIVVDDASLFALSNTANVKPGIVNSTVYLSDSIGLGNESGLQRVSYLQGTTLNTVPYHVRHSIYSHINDTVIVPDLDYSSVPSDAKNELVISASSQVSQSFIFTEDEGDVQIADFLAAYANGDGTNTTGDVLGIVKNERETRAITNRIAQTKTLLLERTN